MSDHKTATIIKILQDGNAGFQLIPTYPFAVIDVVAATADKGPFVCIGGRGDRNDQYYQVTGDVTIMNVAGDILSEVSYDKLMAVVRENALAKDTHDRIMEAAGLDKPPAVWYASTSEQAQPPLSPGGAIQGTEGQQFYNAVSTAIETRYTEPGSGMKFIPSEGFDLMDELIPRGYGPCFSQLFTWMAEAGSTDVWLLFLSTVERDNDDVRGVIEVADLPFIVASKQGPKLVANLTDAEKEKYGLEYQPIIGWKTKDYNHRQMFIVRLIDKKIWDIGLPTAS